MGVCEAPGANVPVVDQVPPCREGCLSVGEASDGILFITLVIFLNWDPGFKFVVTEEQTLS